MTEGPFGRAFSLIYFFFSELVYYIFPTICLKLIYMFCAFILLLLFICSLIFHNLLWFLCCFALKPWLLSYVALYNRSNPFSKLKYPLSKMVLVACGATYFLSLRSRILSHLVYIRGFCLLSLIARTTSIPLAVYPLLKFLISLPRSCIISTIADHLRIYSL